MVKKYSNLEYKEAFISQKYFKGRIWKNLSKKEKVKFADIVTGRY